MSIVIVDKRDGAYAVARLNGMKVLNGGWLSEADLIGLVSKGEQLLNAEVAGGKLVESCGSLDRLKDKNGVSPRVIVAEILSASKRTVGYVIINKAGNISRVRKDALLDVCEKAKGRGVAYLQNGIYKVVDGTPSISCYPGKPFEKMIQGASNQAEKVKPQVDMKANKEAKKENKYTEAQLRELKLAKEKGVNNLIIANPKLSPEQMRIIWVAKKNKMASEYFASPRYSVEVMKFFADRLVNKKMFEDCKILFNPNYSVEQLTELYLGIYSGIDVSEYADEQISADDMYLKRIMLESDYYEAPDEFIPRSDESCAIAFANTLRKKKEK